MDAAAPATSVLERRDVTDTMVDARVARGPHPVAGVAVPARRSRFHVPVALLVGLVFVAVLVAGLNRGSPSNAPAVGQTQSTQSGAPASSTPSTTTAAPSPTAALTAELRAAAGRLSPSDGARAADLASSLRQVADQVQAGNGGPAATGAIISAGAWRLTGQLSEAAATSAVNLLSRVPGVTVVTMPSLPGISLPAAPAPGSGRSDEKGNKGKGGKDD